MADIVPANHNAPEVLYVGPSGETQAGCVAAFQVDTKGKAKPIFWPEPPKGWQVAVQNGPSELILEDGSRSTLLTLLERLRGGK